MLKMRFRGERKRILTPSLSQGEGECSDGKGGMWGRENDYEVVNQRQLFLKTLILTDNFLTFVRFRKL